MDSIHLAWRGFVEYGFLNLEQVSENIMITAGVHSIVNYSTDHLSFEFSDRQKIIIMYQVIIPSKAMTYL